VTTSSKSQHETAPAMERVVFVIDDDLAMRETLGSLFRSVGLRVELFSSTREFAQIKMPEAASCLVLDIRLPGISGLDFQVELAKTGIRIPIIFMTGHGDIPMSVQAMKAGAVDFLTKPFRDQDVLDTVARALERDKARRSVERYRSKLRERFESLTARERQIMTMVTSGLLNKQVAEKIGISEVTVKMHRSHVMQKMGTKSLANLVSFAEKLGIRGDEVNN